MKQFLSTWLVLWFIFPFPTLTIQAFAQAASPEASQSIAPPVPTAKSSGFRLENGTPIKLRLQRTVSSSDAQVNDQVDFDVIEEIKVNDVLIIPKGGVAWGTVTEAQSKRRMARGGKLDVNIDAVRLVDGEKTALRAIKDVKGGGHTGAMTGAMVATGIVFFPAAPLFLFMHGKDITIPKGTEITAYINGDFNLDPLKFSGKAVNEAPTETAHSPQQPAATPAVQVANAELSTVTLKSTPDGSDITVDGNYVGSTPSTIKLTPGNHAIRVVKSGFKIWERTTTVSAGGEITVNAILEKQDISVLQY